MAGTAARPAGIGVGTKKRGHVQQGTSRLGFSHCQRALGTWRRSGARGLWAVPGAVPLAAECSRLERGLEWVATRWGQRSRGGAGDGGALRGQDGMPGIQDHLGQDGQEDGVQRAVGSRSGSLRHTARSGSEGAVPSQGVRAAGARGARGAGGGQWQSWPEGGQCAPSHAGALPRQKEAACRVAGDGGRSV